MKKVTLELTPQELEFMVNSMSHMAALLDFNHAEPGSEEEANFDRISDDLYEHCHKIYHRKGFTPMYNDLSGRLSVLAKNTPGLGSAISWGQEWKHQGGHSDN